MHFQKKMFKDTSQKLNLSLLKYLDLGCKNICKVLDGKYFTFSGKCSTLLLWYKKSHKNA
jgi:hypothetical protein